ncbi:O-Glycosyl hydrolases family 17 protein [Hibiscus syriacus]|uniref:O-Glycosyl hydrolases family 17 protein n=2 Tax=Hibiscus syriacus TaxID=106335 RepID=A0A6A2YEL8_HIBSY|nr:O-Glycosyl hydrolases family 17 protein [Hibiscus syriacus]
MESTPRHRFSRHQQQPEFSGARISHDSSITNKQGRGGAMVDFWVHMNPTAAFIPDDEHDAAKPQMCNYRYQLEEEVKKLQQQLQEETHLHLALASAVEHCGSSSLGKLPDKAQELLDSMAVLEITVSKLEQEFVYLQYQLSQERNERHLSEYHLKHLPCHSTSLFDTFLGYLTEPIARICNEEEAEENTDDMLLPEALVDNNYIVENLWNHPNQLSEEMVLRLRDIFIFLADSSKLSSSSASSASPHCPLAHFLASSLDYVSTIFQWVSSPNPTRTKTRPTDRFTQPRATPICTNQKNSYPRATLH